MVKKAKYSARQARLHKGIQLTKARKSLVKEERRAEVQRARTIRAEEKKVKSIMSQAAKAEVQRARTIRAAEKKEKSIMSQAAKNKRASEKASKERLSSFQKDKASFQKKEIKGRAEDRKGIQGIVTARTKFEGTKLAQAKFAHKVAEARRKLAEKKKKAYLNSWRNKPVVNRKVLRQGPRPVLDLRRRPEREVPVKQHGFKESDITVGNLL